MHDDELMRLAEAADEDEGRQFIRRRRRMEHFRYDEQQEKYWDTTTGTLLAAKSVDGAIPRDEWPTRPDGRSGKLIPFAPSLAINNVDSGLTVEGSTWWPGQPQFIEDHVVTDRGAIPIKGAVCYNRYVPPNRAALNPNGKTPDAWIDHVKMLFPDPVEHEHFFNMAAHMLQRPDEKVNHGIVMAGTYGIGKDTALVPLRMGVGEWNAAEIDPDKISADYNGYIKSVLLVINEVRPHDEDHKASNFYNQLKPILAAPPDMLPMDVKYANTTYVRNLCHVLLTTNDPLTMYVPADDRRLFVMNSPLPNPKTHDVFPDGYFDRMYEYLHSGGADSVVLWLLSRNILQFNPGAPPPMTSGKRAIIDSANQVRRTLADDILENYCEVLFNGNRPEVVFLKDLSDFIHNGVFFDDKDSAIKILQRKNFHFKMDEHGYAMMRNPDASEWRNGKFRSRMAFILKGVPQEHRQRRIEEELMKRPISFDNSKF